MFCKEYPPTVSDSGLNNKFDEDIIYVQNNNYYFRNVDKEITQITNTNETISSGVQFFGDGNRFVYVSYTRGSYKINEISLNHLQHRVIYESNSAIRNLRISPNEDRIYFVKSTTNYWTGSIFYFDLNSQQEIEVNPGPLYQALLFHDCERVFYTTSIPPDYRQRYILNFTTGDTTDHALVHLQFGLGSFVLSPDDNYLASKYNYDGVPSIGIYNTISKEYIHKDIDNDELITIRFTDDSKRYYGVSVDLMAFEWNPSAVIIDIETGKKTVLEMGGDVSNFNTLSYSEKSNKYLYSLNGDIKIYDLNTNKSYDFIVTDANEYAARFVNVK